MENRSRDLVKDKERGGRILLYFTMLQFGFIKMATTITAILLLMYGLIESLVPFMLMRFLDFLQRVNLNRK